ncbi:MAG TPA: NAD(P)/FAD-dependent oxidoreductase [bacterium]
MPRIAVIGGGPAGAVAALQLRRHGFDPVLFERNRIGGLALNANRIDNYLGFPDGISGLKLAGLISEQLRRHAVKFVRDEVSMLDHSRDRFILETSRRRYFFDIVVAASGTYPRRMDKALFHGDDSRVIYGVHPLRHISGRTVAVIGAGDAAFDYALSLQKRNNVYILSRSARAKCLPALWQAALQSRRVVYLGGVCIMKIDINKTRVLIRLRHFNDLIKVNYIVAALGRLPDLAYMKPRLLVLKKQLIRKKVLYVVGDAKNGRYRQIAIATGNGLRAAMEINNKWTTMRRQRDRRV